MKIEDLLTRADTALSSLMPEATVRLLTAIDPKLTYPRNLIKVLLRLRPPAVLLDNSKTREILFQILPQSEAVKLGVLLEWDKKSDVYLFLVQQKFNKSREKTILFDFFELNIPFVDSMGVSPNCVIAQSSYPLFPHQASALRKVEILLQTNPHRVLLHMPTGSGKTRTAMNVVSNYLRSKSKGVVVWLAHSEELCEQAAEEFIKAWSVLGIRDIPLVRYWGEYDCDLIDFDDGVVIAGLKKSFSRLTKDDHQFRALNARNPFVVMDEAHQAIAPTYQLIINQLLRPGSDAQLLGLSATPGRTWNDPEADRELSVFFGFRKVTLEIEGYNNPVSYLIDNKYLATPHFSQIKVATKVFLSDEENSKIKETFEIPTSVLDRLAADEKRNLLIVHHAEDLLLRHKRIILFAASVEQSDLLAAVLSARGFWAVSITSKSPVARAENIAAFKEDDEIRKILCNYGVLTTGFDAPKTSAALIARPTLSLVLYSQMVGRAMRGAEAGGNRECEILTVVDTNLPGFDSVVDAFSNWEDVWRHTNE